jgi:hypothetical protein
MEQRLRDALAGRTPLVIAIGDIPYTGDKTIRLVLTKPLRAKINLEGYGETMADGFLLTRKQAFDLAVDMMTLVGPLDPDNWRTVLGSNPGRGHAVGSVRNELRR